MKTVKAKRKQMTQKDFDAIKTLLAAGLPATKIAQILQRGNGTIWYVGKSNTFEEYQQMLKNISAKKQTQEQLSALPEENNDEFLDRRAVETLNLTLQKLYLVIERIAVALEEANKPLITNTVVEKEEENASNEDLPIL